MSGSIDVVKTAASAASAGFAVSAQPNGGREKDYIHTTDASGLDINRATFFELSIPETILKFLKSDIFTLSLKITAIVIAGFIFESKLSRNIIAYHANF